MSARKHLPDGLVTFLFTDIEGSTRLAQMLGAGYRPVLNEHRQVIRRTLSNADGAGVNDGATMLARLVAQVTAPVRWDLCLATLADLGVTGIIELPPAGTLAGLAKRELKGVEIVVVNTPDDLAAARDLVARHGVVPSHEPTMSFVLAVATVGGTFEPLPDIAVGAQIKAGQVLGHIVTRQGNAEVTAHDSGQLVEWLANNDDPVSPGQPLARIGDLS